MRWTLISLLAIMALGLPSCEPETDDNQVIRGFRPVYANSDAWQQIGREEPRAIRSLGKLALKDGYLFINEYHQGIHIIDNRNPEDPVPIAFLSIPGNTDFDFKGDILYGDNHTDLVTMRMLPDFNVEITQRHSGLYKSELAVYPPDHAGYFECVDPSKGIVIGWIEDDLMNPKCRR